MKLNSVIFHTNRLSDIRAFYEDKLGLPIGTYVKNGLTTPDYSNDYVNYHIEGALLCFEFDSNKTETGTVVINVKDFGAFRKRLEQNGIIVVGGNERYFKIKDPEGRTLIIEPSV
jgi:catechol 2,3-dioxygenase-like lactoylglutathione lyase family enzyme